MMALRTAPRAGPLGPLLAVAILLASTATDTLSAQGQLYVVAAGGGSGVHFTDLPEAVAAATDGDVLLVRPGAYTAFATAKGIAVLADAGAEITRQPRVARPAVSVRDLPAGRTFVLRGLTLTDTPTTGNLLEFASCAGRIVLEDVDARHSSAVTGIDVVDCREVWIQRCNAGGRPAIRLLRSHAVVSDTEATGATGTLFPAGAALHVEDGSAIVAQCLLQGGDALTPAPQTPAGPAIEAIDADLTVTGDGASELRAGGAHPDPVAAIEGSGGSLRLHPETTVVPHGATPAIAPAIPWSHVEVPTLRIGPAELGTPLDVEVFGRPGGSVALVVSLPGPRLPLGPWGAWWLDPSVPAVVLSASVPPSRRIAVTAMVPSAPQLLGVVVAWQVAEITATGPFLLGNPVAYTHGP